jgi:hypothetical protein
MSAQTEKGKMSDSTGAKAVAGVPAAIVGPAVSASAGATPPGESPPIAPLFRRVDWLALLIAFVVVWTVYLLTLAPEETLQDSGELCTGAFYAGIPHPPGYPFWTIYAWVWTKILPIGNVAWRVEVGQSFAAALACGLVAFMVSRGASMLMEGIEALKEIGRKEENAICAVTGVIAGLLLGLGGVMWTESVAINRISLFGVPWVMIVMLCLLRWIYAPAQRRYLYCAMFCFGICATIHQTLLVAAVGIEIAIASVQPKLGRDLFLANSVIYVAGLIGKATHFTTLLDTAPMLLALYHIVGLGSIIACAWLSLKTKKLGQEWKAVLVMGVLWAAGASFYFYEAIAGMTNPPMEWGYPRTVEGFYHALSRGQYEKASPSPIFAHPGHFLLQIGMLIGDVVHEYNWVCLLVALVPLLFFAKMKARERSWMIALISVYVCIGGVLLILMNPQPDRQSAELHRVFFTSSHAIIAILTGYGFALTTAFMATHYQRFRKAGLLLGVVALAPALAMVYDGISDTFYGGRGFLPYHLVLPVFILLALAFALTAIVARSLFTPPEVAGAAEEKASCSAPAKRPGQKTGAQSQKAESPVPAAPFLMSLGRSPREVGAAAVVLIAAVMGIIFLRGDSLSFGQIGSALGRLFAPHQYSSPALAGLLVLAIVLGFVGALWKFRGAAPLNVTLGLFALMPIASGLSHWAGSEQRDHWFGYWFGHDMFTPPVAGPGGKLTYDGKVRAQMMKGPDAKLVYPEMDKDTILFGGTDPGRFNPTYMIFCDSFLPDSCKPAVDPVFDRRDVYLITQNALADQTYLCYLRAQYFRSQQIDPPFFSELARNVLKDKEFETNLVARMVSPLDSVFEARGARVEKRWRTGTSWFVKEDFVDLPDFGRKLQPSSGQDAFSRWLYQNLSKETQALLTRNNDERGLPAALMKDLNALLAKNEWLYQPDRFAGMHLSDYLQKFIAQKPAGDARLRLNRLLLEAAYPVALRKSAGGVYPDREIYIPSPMDHQQIMTEYTSDAARRFQHDAKFAGEPRQVRPGEGVSLTPDGRISVSGIASVMGINALLTKAIFDRNPDNAFYIEESFPLEWMFPHLTPYGIILKINRQPLAELSDETCRRDHEFWSKYSERLVGNWITYDTTVKQLTDFVERVYSHRNYAGFTGDRRFLRDDQAQKSFSKLRSSIGGVYSWRLGLAPTGAAVAPQYLPTTNESRLRMMREAEFAYKQAFAFCPYSPDVISRYLTLLMAERRFAEGLLIAETCLKLDPYNDYFKGLVGNLREANERFPGQ